MFTPLSIVTVSVVSLWELNIIASDFSLHHLRVSAFTCMRFEPTCMYSSLIFKKTIKIVCTLLIQAFTSSFFSISPSSFSAYFIAALNISPWHNYLVFLPSSFIVHQLSARCWLSRVSQLSRVSPFLRVSPLLRVSEWPPSPPAWFLCTQDFVKMAMSNFVCILSS